MKTKREYEEAFDLIDIFTSCGSMRLMIVIVVLPIIRG